VQPEMSATLLARLCNSCGYHAYLCQ